MLQFLRAAPPGLKSLQRDSYQELHKDDGNLKRIPQRPVENAWKIFYLPENVASLRRKSETFLRKTVKWKLAVKCHTTGGFLFNHLHLCLSLIQWQTMMLHNYDILYKKRTVKAAFTPVLIPQKNYTGSIQTTICSCCYLR